MKYALPALTLAIAGASACLASAPSDRAPGLRSPVQPVPMASFQPRSTICDLQLSGPRLVALANPAEADSWSLTVEAPDLYNQQSGPVTGAGTQLKPLTTIVMEDNPVSIEEGVMVMGDPMLPRPFDAELRAFDGRGALICRDVIRLPELDPPASRPIRRRF